MSPWGWTPERTLGIWRHGAVWMRPVVAAAPYLTVLLLMTMFLFVGGTMTAASGILFDLPEADVSEGACTGQVALVMPMPNETMVFFDDSRYLLGDPASVRAFGEHLANRFSSSEAKTLLVLADRRVAGGELMRLASLVRRHGAERILFAEKKSEDSK